MGINMNVKMIIGVKYDKLPDNIIDEDRELLNHETKLQYYPDCYSGEWGILGIELNSYQDTRYEQLDFS